LTPHPTYACASPRPARTAYSTAANMADFSDLPHGVLLKVFIGLTRPINPDSVRDLCASASVCPSWREAAKEPSLWRELVVNKAPLNERLTGRRLRNLVARSHNTLTRLLLEGCPLVIDTALARAVQTQPCLVFVNVEDCARISRHGLAHALCDSENFLEIVEQLNDPRQSVADAQRCCVAFKVVLGAEDEEATLAEAQAAGALHALLRCAALHAAHAGVQAACCLALSEYVYAAPDTEVAFLPPIFQAAVAALKAHPLDMYVQRAALLALCNACWYGLEGTPGVPALLDAIQHVLAALRAFPTDLELQECGCDSLESMCYMYASVAEAVAAAGAMGLFIKVLNLDCTNNNTLTVAIDAIRVIALSKAALPQASAGIDAVVHALRRHESSKLAVAACRTLGIYLRSPATRERAVQAGAEAAIWEAFAEFSNNDDKAVLYAANYALQDTQA